MHRRARRTFKRSVVDRRAVINKKALTEADIRTKFITRVLIGSRGVGELTGMDPVGPAADDPHLAVLA